MQQVLMQQYNQAFEEILFWHDENSWNKGRDLLLRERTPNYDLVMETLVQAFAEKYYSALDRGERDQNRENRDRLGRGDQGDRNQDRQVTEAELQ